MKALRKIAVLAAAAIAMASCAQIPDIPVTGGLVRGVKSGTPGVTVFKGIPYAAPPVDTLRWREPAPVIPWEGVKVADTFGPICWQEDITDMDLYGKEFYSDGMPEMSEDCLYLNVWAPTKALNKVSAKLPVVFWIHGGSFDHGWGNEIEMNGEEWAKRGVIFVSFNYRVGMLGFYTSTDLVADGNKGRAGNFGIYDQLAALTWVGDNIGRFGGDLDNVTLMGQGAGAESIKILCQSPLVKFRFSKCIIQSGGGIRQKQQNDVSNILVSQLEGKDLMREAGIDSVAQMRAMSPEQLNEVYKNFIAHHGSYSLKPQTDYFLVGPSFSTAVYLKSVADVPYMIGYTDGDGPRMAIEIDEFCASRNYYSKEPVYQYKFDRKLPGDDAGAYPASELWYMLGTLDKCWRPMTHKDKVLSREMLDAWTNFCKYGDPNGEEPSDFWPPFTQDNPYRKIFDVK